MQSPNEIQPIPGNDLLKTRALGCLVLIGIVLVLPVVCAALFYFVSVAAWNYHAMVIAINGAL